MIVRNPSDKRHLPREPDGKPISILLSSVKVKLRHLAREERRSNGLLEPFTLWLTAGCVPNTRSAARVKLPSSTTARNVLPLQQVRGASLTGPGLSTSR